MHVLAACRRFSVRRVQREREGERQVAIQRDMRAVGMRRIVVVIRRHRCVEHVRRVWCAQRLVHVVGVVVVVMTVTVTMIVIVVTMFVQMFMGKCRTEGVQLVRNVRRLTCSEQQGVIQHQQQRKEDLSRHARGRPGLVESGRL